MDVGVALTEVKAYRDSARNLEDRAGILLNSLKITWKNSKRLWASIKNLKSIHQSLLKELERSRPQQAFGNVIDQSFFLAMKNLEQALSYQRQAENKLSQIQTFEKQAQLIKESTELLDYSFVTIVKTLKLLHQRK